MRVVGQHCHCFTLDSGSCYATVGCEICAVISRDGYSCRGCACKSNCLYRVGSSNFPIASFFKVTCSCNSLFVLLNDNICLFKFFICLNKAPFIFNFNWVPERATHTLSIVGLHSLKCSMILSSDIFFSSLSSMITFWASLSCFLSQFYYFLLLLVR